MDTVVTIRHTDGTDLHLAFGYFKGFSKELARAFYRDEHEALSPAQHAADVVGTLYDAACNQTDNDHWNGIGLSPEFPPIEVKHTHHVVDLPNRKIVLRDYNTGETKVEFGFDEFYDRFYG